MTDAIAKFRLGEISTINPRPTVRPAPENTVSFIGMADVNAPTGTTSAGTDRRYEDVSKGYTRFVDRDILIAKITPCFENGKIAQARTRHADAVGSTEFHVVRPDRTRIYDQYLLRFLRQPHIRIAGERRMTGSGGQRRVPESFLAELEIPVPSLREQRRIADILGRVDESRIKREDAIALLDDLAESVFLDMFGSLERVSTETLGEHISFVTSGSRGWAKYYSPKGRRFIRSLDVRMNYIGNGNCVYVTPPDSAESRRTQVEPGDVLLTITGSLIGRVSSVPGELQGSYVSQHVAIIRPLQSIKPEYLSRYLSLVSGGQRQISQMQYGQTKPGLNLQQIRSFKIPVPKLSLQEKYVERVAAVERNKASHKAHLTRIEALFASLQHRAFRGEL